jgi:GR25 family glycosyltransferase involved in LPS biosynthesis
MDNVSLKCYCISLVENERDRILCQEEFARIGLNVEFEIVERDPEGGCKGCFTSHINVLKKGLATNSEFIMVMEDDVYFDYSDPEIFNKIFSFLKSLNSNFSGECKNTCQHLSHGHWCFCFGCFTNSKAIPITKEIVSLEKAYCTHSYVVGRQTAQKLIEMEWKGTSFDISWHGVVELFYAAYPNIAFQRDHDSSISSDIGKSFLNIVGFKNVARLSEWWAYNKPF